MYPAFSPLRTAEDPYNFIDSRDAVGFKQAMEILIDSVQPATTGEI